MAKAPTGRKADPKPKGFDLPVGAVEGLTTGSADTSAILGLSQRRLRQLVDDGVIPDGKGGRYPTAAVSRAYIEWLKDEQRKASKTAASSKKDDARTRLLELEIAEKARDLVALEEHIAVVQEMAGIIKSGLGGLAARITRDGDLRAKIETAVNDVLDTLSTRLVETSRSLRASGVASGPVTADDA